MGKYRTHTFPFTSALFFLSFFWGSIFPPPPPADVVVAKTLNIYSGFLVVVCRGGTIQSIPLKYIPSRYTLD